MLPAYSSAARRRGSNVVRASNRGGLHRPQFSIRQMNGC
jgi:hypothetical protein